MKTITPFLLRKHLLSFSVPQDTYPWKKASSFPSKIFIIWNKDAIYLLLSNSHTCWSRAKVSYWHGRTWAHHFNQTYNIMQALLYSIPLKLLLLTTAHIAFSSSKFRSLPLKWRGGGGKGASCLFPTLGSREATESWLWMHRTSVMSFFLFLKTINANNWCSKYS